MGSPSSYGWASKLVIQLAKLDHANVGFLLEADPPTRHLVCLLLRGWENRGKDAAALERFAGEVHSQSRRSLVRQFWGIDPSGSLMPFLARLGTRTMPRAAYDALGTVLGDPTRRRLAAQGVRLSAAELGAFARHDPGLVEAVGVEVAHGLGAEALEHLVAAVLVRRDDLCRNQVLRKLRGHTDQDELGETICGLLANCRLEVPWIGTERIRPLRSPAAMGKAARRFRNCLGNPETQWRALSGDAAFYVCDDGPLVAELRCDRIARRWHLQELRGPRNRAPTARALGAVVTAFGAAGYWRLDHGRLPWAGWL